MSSMGGIGDGAWFIGSRAILIGAMAAIIAIGIVAVLVIA